MICMLDDFISLLKRLENCSIPLEYLIEIQKKKSDISKSLDGFYNDLYKSKKVNSKKEAFKKLLEFRSKMLDIQLYMHDMCNLTKSNDLQNYTKENIGTIKCNDISTKSPKNVSNLFFEMIEQICVLSTFFKEDISCEIMRAKREIESLQHTIFLMSNYIAHEQEKEGSLQVLAFLKNVHCYFIVMLSHIGYIYWFTNFWFIHRYLRKHND